MNGLETALQLLPSRYLSQGKRALFEGAEEIRMRLGQALTVVRAQREYPVSAEPITDCDLHHTLEKATGASFHSALPSMTRGFVSYRGLRVGVCGSVAVHNGEIRGFRSISSIAVRIFKECRGICDELMPDLEKPGAGNILILSPPGGGKTTALRELIRLFSGRGVRVGLVDERWEIAGAEGGGVQFDLGGRCDVLSGVEKAAGAMMLLRGMNPQLIAMDEITQAEDIEAIREIVGCGVRLAATAHAASTEDLFRRPLYRSLAEERIFSEIVLIRQSGEKRSYQRRRLEA